MKKTIKTCLLVLFLTFTALLVFKQPVLAADAPGVNEANDAGSGQADSIFGEIEAPQGVSQLNDQDDSGMGLILFISNIIKIISIVAGVWTMFNFIIAGFTYITSAHDSGKIAKIGETLTNSVVGLVIIVASYTIAAIIGLLIFGDATYIINPQIPTAL